MIWNEILISNFCKDNCFVFGVVIGRNRGSTFFSSIRIQILLVAYHISIDWHVRFCNVSVFPISNFVVQHLGLVRAPF